MRNLTEGDLLRAKDGRLAIFAGECLACSLLAGERKKCLGGGITFFDTGYSECSNGIRFKPTGFCLPEEQTTFLTAGFNGSCFLSTPRGFHLPMPTAFPELPRFFPGRVLIREEENGYLLFIVLLSLSTNTIKEAELMFWQIGNLGLTTMPLLDLGNIFDTKLQLPSFQVQGLASRLGISH
jgi:hypothetical protein